MGVVLPPLEFTECLSDSPYFRENLHKHERELEKTNQQIKRIIKEVKDLLAAERQLGDAQKSFATCLRTFTFETIGGTQTDDETTICNSLKTFSELILQVEEERKRMVDNANSTVLKPLEEFRKKYIGGVKNEKKKFEKQTAKFCQNQERYLNKTTKNPNTLQEADASVDMAERHFYAASMDYVYLIQEVHERKKFEFVESLLTFVYAYFTFYHQGHEIKKDFDPFMKDLQSKIQKTRGNFDDFSEKLKKRMSEVQKQEGPLSTSKGCKEGYLFLLEKKAFGTTWTKNYCKYDKNTKEFTMLPYNQLTTKTLPQPEKLVITTCIRRKSESIDKRFCFDIQADSKPGVVYTLQALSEQDRTSWMDIMDGKEPTYTVPSNKVTNTMDENYVLDDVGIQFVKKCIEVLENRGLEEQGIYRVVGVASKVNKLLAMGLDRRKNDKLNLEDPQEWETKTITSALKTYLRNLPEPLMSYKYHNDFINAVKRDSKQNRVHEVHKLLYKISRTNFEVLKILIKHLTNVAEKSEKNLMTISNLGVCFGPTLLRPEEETVASIMDLKFYNIVVEILIENYNRLFFTEPLVPKFGQLPPNNHLPTDSGETYAGNKVYSGGQPVRVSPSYRNPPGYNPSVPYNITVSSYIDQQPLPINLYSSIPEPISDSIMYGMSRSEHRPSNHQRFKQYNSSSINSQSESNIPQTITSPTNFRQNRLGAFSGGDSNETSSSNDSLSSTSRDGNTVISGIPKKHERANLSVAYPKSYKAQGNVRVRTLYACLGEHDGELSFEPNQIITNVKTSQEPGWLEGTLNGKTGLIPENYVEILP
ncbi:rho GTPase-activating protein 26 isoform X2 [Anthonomus grandis grandis]|uniref:rho GTPase-activating protein 26 isoform X2 n=1 Tax=Anthonomus grandis grandis TaxID=2921223 RepID=UPI0021658801|nr:rho GTPase-activating protein 26 isoform X2 [Anthonomus grandis grandis]